MNPKTLIFLLAILAFYFPGVANAGDIDIDTGNIRVRTEQNGSTSVNTNRNEIKIDRRRTHTVPWWKSWHYWDRGNRNCHNGTYQRTTQTTNVNGHIHRDSTTTCR